MLKHDITINSDGSSLSATVCRPEEKGRVPFVLMIHGTGPLDRDENMKGQRIDAFNTIAHHLAAGGIASLRYDKRGCGRSTGDYYRAGHADSSAMPSAALTRSGSSTSATLTGYSSWGTVRVVSSRLK